MPDKAVEAEADAPDPPRGLGTVTVAVAEVAVVSIATFGSVNALEFLFVVRPFPEAPCPLTVLAAAVVRGDWVVVAGAAVIVGAGATLRWLAGRSALVVGAASPLLGLLNAST